MVLNFMADILSSAGYEVHTAENGLQAFDILDSIIPDHMFVDLVMPEIDGKQLLEVIKTMESLHNTTKIILSAGKLSRSQLKA